MLGFACRLVLLCAAVVGFDPDGGLIGPARSREAVPHRDIRRAVGEVRFRDIHIVRPGGQCDSSRELAIDVRLRCPLRVKGASLNSLIGRTATSGSSGGALAELRCGPHRFTASEQRALACAGSTACPSRGTLLNFPVSSSKEYDHVASFAPFDANTYRGVVQFEGDTWISIAEHNCSLQFFSEFGMTSCNNQALSGSVSLQWGATEVIDILVVPADQVLAAPAINSTFSSMLEESSANWESLSGGESEEASEAVEEDEGMEEGMEVEEGHKTWSEEAMESGMEGPGASFIDGSIGPVSDEWNDQMAPQIAGFASMVNSHEALFRIPAMVVSPLSISLVYNLTNLLSDSINIGVSQYVSKVIMANIVDKIGLAIIQKTTPVVFSVVSQRLIDQVPESFNEAAPKFLERSLTFNLADALTRSISHSLVPSLAFTLKHRPVQNYYCMQCYERGKYCERCNANPKSMYYLIYYSGFYTDYYARYYSDYYTHGLDSWVRNKIVRENSPAWQAKAAQYENGLTM